MTNANEELWRAFDEEVSEQLDNLDLELLKGAEACNIHQVFRDCHTIKSSCAMLDLTSMKDLAHISEDYLDLVRKEGTKLTDQSIDLLLSAVEMLKRQFAVAIKTRKNPEAATEVIARLKALLPKTNPARSAISHHQKEDAQPLALMPIEKNEINEEFIEFSHVSVDALLAVSMASQFNADIKNHLVNMANMAELLEFPLIQSLARDILLEFRKADNASSPALIRHQVDLIERLRFFEKFYECDFGVKNAEKNWRITHEKYFIRLVLDLVQEFSVLQKIGVTAQATAHHEKSEVILEQLVALASLCGLIELSNLLRYIAQITRNARRGYFEFSVSIASAMRSAIDHPYVIMLEDGEEEFIEEMLRSRRMLETALHTGHHNLQDHAASASAEPTMVSRFINRLNHENTEALDKSIKAGMSLYEIDVDMDEASGIAEELLEWLMAHGTILHNVSAFNPLENNSNHQQDASIIFLVAIPMSLEVLNSNLLKIDNHGAHFTIRVHHALVESQKDIAVKAALPEMPQIHSSTLRINSRAVDDLVTHVGEVVMLRNMIDSMINREKHEIIIRKCKYLLEKDKNNLANQSELDELKENILELIALRDGLQQADVRLQSSIHQVQQKVLDLREMPVSMVFSRLPNIVRKISQTSGKLVNLKMEANEVCIDKGMMDILLKTLVAIINKLIAHITESEVDIIINAATRGSILTIGVECAALLHANHSHFSEIKSWLDKIGGQFVIDKAAGKNTLVTLDFPRSVAMQTVLLVRSGASATAIPERNVLEIQRFRNHKVQIIRGRAAISWRGEVIPLASLNEWSHAQRHDHQLLQRASGSLIIVNSGLQKVGILVEHIVGIRDVFVPEIHVSMSSILHLNGTTVLGDGSIVFILNVEYLMQALYDKIHSIFLPQTRQEMVA